MGMILIVVSCVLCVYFNSIYFSNDILVNGRHTKRSVSRLTDCHDITYSVENGVEVLNKIKPISILYKFK